MKIAISPIVDSLQFLGIMNVPIFHRLSLVAILSYYSRKRE